MIGYAMVGASDIRQRHDDCIFGILRALCGGKTDPGVGLYVVFGHAFAYGVHETKPGLRIGISLFRGFLHSIEIILHRMRRTRKQHQA